MTPLEKPVNRKTLGSYRILYQTPRQIIVALKPGDILEFREAGRRQHYSLPIDYVFKVAVRNHANNLRIEKRKLRQAKRKAK